MPIVVTYARQSVSRSPNLDLNFSIGAQTNAMQKFSASKGWTISKEFIDVDFSGATLKRPAFQKLLAFIKVNNVDYVLVDRIDRLSRGGMSDLTFILDFFEQNHVFLQVVQLDLNTFNANRKFQLTFAALMGQFQLDIIRENQHIALLKKVSSGKAISSSVPFGYDYVPEQSTVSINSTNAQIVRSIFDKHINNGVGAHKIAKEINSEWNTHLHHYDVNNILKRAATYAGNYNYSGTTYTNVFPAIISIDTANKSTLIREANSYQRLDKLILLSRKIRCPTCNHYLHYQRQQHGKYIYYNCTSKKCKVNINASKVEANVTKPILELLSSKKFIYQFTLQVQKAAGPLREQRTRKKVGIKNSRISILNKFQSGKLSNQDMTKQLQVLVEKEKKLSASTLTEIEKANNQFWSDLSLQLQVINKLVDHVSVLDNRFNQQKSLTGIFLKNDVTVNILNTPIAL